MKKVQVAPLKERIIDAMPDGREGNALERALTEHEAAQIINKAVQSLRNERHRGVGCPYVKIGKSVRYLVSDIIDYLRKHRIDPEAI